MTTETRTALDDVLQILGSRKALAALCGVTEPAIFKWVRDARIPVAHCPTIEAATGGRVRCEAMRPDVAWHLIRKAAA